MKQTSSKAGKNTLVVDALDQAITCQENIFAIASLLEDSRNGDAGTPENRVIASVGRIIAAQARRLGAALDILENQHSQLLEGSRGKERQHQGKS